MMDINKILGKRVINPMKNFGLKSFGGKNDLDFDGVPNRKDCQPRNTMRQDTGRPLERYRLISNFALSLGYRAAANYLDDRAGYRRRKVEFIKDSGYKTLPEFPKEFKPELNKIISYAKRIYKKDFQSGDLIKSYGGEVGVRLILEESTVR